MWCHVVACGVMGVMWYYVVLCADMWCYAVLFGVTWRYVALRVLMYSYLTLCDVV